jgi:hypothetical protein
MRSSPARSIKKEIDGREYPPFAKCSFHMYMILVPYFSSQHIPCVESVFEPQPKEDFMLWLAFVFLEPLINNMNIGVSN